MSLFDALEEVFSPRRERLEVHQRPQKTDRGQEQTPTYPNANRVVSSSYPISENPSFTIKELIAFDIPVDKELDITTTGGQTITGVEPKRTGFVLSTIEIDSFTVRDPDGTGGETSLLWSGE